jgi:hypothetical protein
MFAPTRCCNRRDQKSYVAPTKNTRPGSGIGAPVYGFFAEVVDVIGVGEGGHAALQRNAVRDGATETPAKTLRRDAHLLADLCSKCIVENDPSFPRFANLA